MGVNMRSKFFPLDYLTASEDCLHISCYLSNEGTVNDFKKSLKNIINEMEQVFESDPAINDKSILLKPLYDIVDNHNFIKKLTNNLGIFINKKQTLLLEIPFGIDNKSFISKQFHIKPLLSWHQSRKSFFIVGLNKDKVELYFVQGKKYQIVESILLPEILAKFDHINKPNEIDREDYHSKMNETIDWLAYWIETKYGKGYMDLFIVGDRQLRHRLLWQIELTNVHDVEDVEVFNGDNLDSIISNINKSININLTTELEKLVLEYSEADRKGRVVKDISLIVKNTLKGNVKKLIISKENHIFGKINKSTGEIYIHENQLDHEGDDISNYLAQIIIAAGGVVVILPQIDMPDNIICSAILRDD
jgi:hypothetical protein